MRSSARLLLPLAAACAVAACSPGQSGSKAAAAPQAKEVGVITVQTQRLAIETQLPGRTNAQMIAEIRPQVGGIIQKRLFEEGALVKAGQVLYQIDPATFQAAHNSALASVRKAESTVATARITAARNAELVKIDAISRQVNDESQAALAQAQADLGVARATEESARINLGFTRITSPISGRVGLSSVTPGALVTANQATALATVQQLDPVYVDVTQSSAELLRLKRELAEGRLKRSGRSDESEARIKLILEDGSTYPLEGRLTFSGLTVNTGTGAITLRASVPNPDGLLMPGMYVRAVLETGVDERAILVPQQAVTRATDGSTSVLVVGADNKVVRRPLTVDRAVGNRWQVTSGLAAGERVLVEGSLRAKPGDSVRAVAVDAADTSLAATRGSGAAGGASGAAAGAAGAAAVR